MSSKINNTYGAGYRMDHDFDARKFEDDRKKEAKHSGGGARGKKRGRDPATGLVEGQGPAAVKRQTWMLPFTFICEHCGRRNSKASKLYANVTKLPKEQWYLEKIAIFHLVIRCIFCPGFVRFETDPENGTYNILTGGKRIEGDWKELQDQAKEKDDDRNKLLSDSQAKHSDMLMESQRNAEQAESLAKLLSLRSKVNKNKVLAKTLAAVKSRVATTLPQATMRGGGVGTGMPNFDDADDETSCDEGEDFGDDLLLASSGQPGTTGCELEEGEEEDPDEEGEVFTMEWEDVQDNQLDDAARDKATQGDDEAQQQQPQYGHKEMSVGDDGSSSSSSDEDEDAEPNPFLITDDLLENDHEVVPKERKVHDTAASAKKPLAGGGALSRLF